MIAFDKEILPVWVYEMSDDDLLDYQGPKKLRTYMLEKAVEQYAQAGNVLTQDVKYEYGIDAIGTPPDYFTGMYIKIYDHPNIKDAFMVEVEYDTRFRGGNYSGVGHIIKFPLPEKMINRNDVARRFKRLTGLEYQNIIHWNAYPYEVYLERWSDHGEQDN